MFEPNQVGQLSKFAGRDVHSRIRYATPTSCPFAAVNMDIGSQKTSVRADSSASRGSADETASQRAKVLIAPYIDVAINDLFECADGKFVVMSKHVRRSVFGGVDHFECDLEVVPG